MLVGLFVLLFLVLRIYEWLLFSPFWLIVVVCRGVCFLFCVRLYALLVGYCLFSLDENPLLADFDVAMAECRRCHRLMLSLVVFISCACHLWKRPDVIVGGIIVVAVGCGINQLCSETCSEIWSRGECLGAVVSGIVLVMVTSWLWILRVVRLVTRYGRETCDEIVT